jgi:hypothetical protein
MKKTEIEMKRGKKYEGNWNGKIYGDSLYLKGCGNSYYINVNGSESCRKEIKINAADVAVMPNQDMPKTTESWMTEMEKTEKQN